ncbi:phBC6A51 family helix-turn-helix protein [Paenibacillus sp. NRS-1782]|uniref:phBC6A51 family helix-turn-helix protein n=1 Tax=unclassified Paenibacillus TaxID=185978 RepID=UPI003D2CED90
MNLEMKHYTAIRYLSLPPSERPTLAEIAEECGVTPSALYQWRQDSIFEAELKRQIVRNNVDDLPELIALIPKIAITEKNAAMAKLALQVHGMLSDKVEVSTTTNSGGGTDIAALKARIEALKVRQASDE